MDQEKLELTIGELKFGVDQLTDKQWREIVADQISYVASKCDFMVAIDAIKDGLEHHLSHSVPGMKEEAAQVSADTTLGLLLLHFAQRCMNALDKEQEIEFGCQVLGHLLKRHGADGYKAVQELTDLFEQSYMGPERTLH